MEIFILGVSVLAPGLANWEEGRKILGGESPYKIAPVPPFNAEILPAVERRRSSETARWAVTVAKEALTMSKLSGKEVATVFASSDGDGQIINQICETLGSSEPTISPTRFHNSVHNAPAGYWSIMNQSQQASNSVAAYDDSFAAGLLEATVYAVVEQQAVLLAAFDLPFPAPLNQLRSIDYGFGMALILSPIKTGNALMKCEIDFVHEKIAAYLNGISQPLRNNPAARSWPLLEVLAKENEATIQLAYNSSAYLKIKFGNL